MKKFDISEMSYSELVAKNIALQEDIKNKMEEAYALQLAIKNRREEEMKRAFEELLKNFSATKEEMMKLFYGEDVTTVSENTLDSEKESPALPETVQEKNVVPAEEQDSINSENKEEEESKAATTSIWDHPALTAPYNPVAIKKREMPAALPAPVQEKEDSIIPEPQKENRVEKAIELAKNLPLAKGIDEREPYFVTYDFAVSKKGELTLDAETFGRNETAEMISKIKVENISSAKLLHAIDVVSTDDCTAYMWYEGKYITVTFYSVPIKETTGTESEEILPSMDSLLSDDPEYKAFYHPATPRKKSNRSLLTMDELLSGNPINRILCLGNEEPKGKAFRQHTRINHVGGIIPTETATGKTGVYIPPTPTMAA